MRAGREAARRGAIFETTVNLFRTQLYTRRRRRRRPRRLSSDFFRRFSGAATARRAPINLPARETRGAWPDGESETIPSSLIANYPGIQKTTDGTAGNFSGGPDDGHGDDSDRRARRSAIWRYRRDGRLNHRLRRTYRRRWDLFEETKPGQAFRRIGTSGRRSFAWRYRRPRKMRNEVNDGESSSNPLRARRFFRRQRRRARDGSPCKYLLHKSARQNAPARALRWITLLLVWLFPTTRVILGTEGWLQKEQSAPERHIGGHENEMGISVAE